VFLLSIAAGYIVVTRTNLFVDNTLAVNVRKQIVLTPIVNGDGLLRYRAIYDKRPYCDVKGGAYEIKGKTDQGNDVHVTNIQPRTYGTWTVGVSQETLSTVELPKNLPDGDYQIRWTYAYKCAGTIRQQSITSPWMAFERVRRSVHDFAAPVAP
jgi:hypothetical protein